MSRTSERVLADFVSCRRQIIAQWLCRILELRLDYGCNFENLGEDEDEDE